MHERLGIGPSALRYVSASSIVRRPDRPALPGRGSGRGHCRPDVGSECRAVRCQIPNQPIGEDAAGARASTDHAYQSRCPGGLVVGPGTGSEAEPGRVRFGWAAGGPALRSSQRLAAGRSTGVAFSERLQHPHCGPEQTDDVFLTGKAAGGKPIYAPAGHRSQERECADCRGGPRPGRLPGLGDQ